jgi:hypothetical protein
MASIFPDKTARPTDGNLATALGRTKAHWDAIVGHVAREHPNLARDWKFYGSKYGWQLRIIRKRSVVLYLIPHAGSFLVATALKSEALARLRESGLPSNLVAEIEAAKTYAEGRPARVEVTEEPQVDVVLRLLALVLSE